jgi:predicted PurR-regulated permease PerM
MKAIIHPPVHESYKRHRKELAWQIIVPVVLSAILIVGVIVLVNVATFRDNGDVGRWAAISTIWIVIPIMVAGLIFLIILGGIVYLLKYLLQIAPTYTGQAQDFVHKIARYIERVADAIVKPVIALDGIGASMKRLVGRK